MINELKTYTPEQAAKIFQVKKNTIYSWIGRGEIIAKKIGKSYRIPATSLSFALTGLDYDIYQAEQVDRQSLDRVELVLKKARSK